MLDFRELPKDGQDFELLTRELLFLMGLYPFWSGRGPDGGRDLLCDESQASIFLPSKKRWLIQCKHNAHSNASVGVSDLDNIVDSCHHHHATGYLLVCSTYPSSGVVQRLEGINANSTNLISATFWDAVRVEQLLSFPSRWTLAQRFFPESAHRNGWRLYATEHPNRWIANFKGYYFHLSNRIGSSGEQHLRSVAKCIEHMEAIQLPTEHMLRVRAVHFDDKHGNYRWYLDYLYPSYKSPMYTAEMIKRILYDDGAHEDGQWYFFDILSHEYKPGSDHHDEDHYRYYEPYLKDFLWGGEREQK